MIEQGNRTQQLIYRTSYRKHRQRLAGIKHNITTTDFLPPRQAHSGKKSQHKDRVRKEEIEANNHHLKNKISAIKNRNHSKLEELYSTEQVRKQPKRYFDDGTEVRIEVNSELNNDGENYKFILPSGKTPSYSQNVKGRDAKIDANIVSKGNSIEKCYKKYTSNSVLKESEKELKSNNKDREILYNLPERNQNRVVIYKKTLIISSMQSCMLELSLINDRLLIAAYMMGLENTTLRQLLPPKRSADILKEYQNNYDEFCSRIAVQKVGEKYQFIRINHKEDSKDKAQPEEDKLKQKVKIQNEFIKRNYYTLAKSDEDSKLETQKEKAGASFQQVQAIVERLAVPKRLYKFREEKLEKIEKIDKVQKIEKPRVVSNYQKESKPNQNSQEELPRNINRRSLEKSKESQSSLTKSKDPIVKLPQKQSQQEVKKSLPEPKKEEEPEQRYEQEQQNYEQQFDNPSEVKKQPTPIDPAPSQPHHLKNSSQVYENDFQNQPEKVQPQQEQYQQEFQESNPKSPLPKKQVIPATPIDGVDQQYQEEFAD